VIITAFAVKYPDHAHRQQLCQGWGQGFEFVFAASAPNFPDARTSWQTYRTRSKGFGRSLVLVVPLLSVYMTTVVMNGGGAIMREIQLRDAKASLSAVVDDVVRGEPAIITRHGKKEAVILSFKEWGRLSQVPSFGRLLMAAPIAPEDLPECDRTPLRTADL
jgi:antitoxin Phd